MANDAAVNNALMQADAVRMIGIRKKAGEPLVRDTHTHTYTYTYTYTHTRTLVAYVCVLCV